MVQTFSLQNSWRSVHLVTIMSELPPDQTIHNSRAFEFFIFAETMVEGGEEIQLTNGASAFIRPVADFTLELLDVRWVAPLKCVRAEGGRVRFKETSSEPILVASFIDLLWEDWMKFAEFQRSSSSILMRSANREGGELYIVRPAPRNENGVSITYADRNHALAIEAQLRNYLPTAPANQPPIDLAGAVHDLIRDFDRALRRWMLTHFWMRFFNPPTTVGIVWYEENMPSEETGKFVDEDGDKIDDYAHLFINTGDGTGEGECEYGESDFTHEQAAEFKAAALGMVYGQLSSASGPVKVQRIGGGISVIASAHGIHGVHIINNEIALALDAYFRGGAAARQTTLVDCL